LSTLAKKVYLTVHKTNLSVEELADRLGCSASLLYKAANPDDPVDLKLGWLIPLMEVTRNHAILHHLANRLGYVAVRVPRSKKMKPAEIAEHQAALVEHVTALIRFTAGEIDKEEALEKVNVALTQVAGARKMVEASGPQEEFEF